MDNGATYFIRCADCHAMYRAEEGLNMHTGESMPCWFRPKSVTKPKRCKHLGGAEIWDGTAWQAAGVKDR